MPLPLSTTARWYTLASVSLAAALSPACSSPSAGSSTAQAEVASPAADAGWAIDAATDAGWGIDAADAGFASDAALSCPELASDGGLPADCSGMAPVSSAACTVSSFYAAIGQGDPALVMPALGWLVDPAATWVVPGGNALTTTESTDPYTFQGLDEIGLYIGRLHDLSGQDAGGVVDPASGLTTTRFVPSLVSQTGATASDDGALHVTVSAAATAVRGGIALDGHPELNDASGTDPVDGRVHGVGLYTLDVTLSADGRTIVGLETVPHDVGLFNGFWGPAPPPYVDPTRDPHADGC
jgi:hypothetical protein